MARLAAVTPMTGSRDLPDQVGPVVAPCVSRQNECEDGRERGSAVLEFIVLAVLLLVPVFYLVATLSRVQAASYAVTLAAREAGRAFVTADSDKEADGRARVAADVAYADFGFDGGQLGISCSSSPCLTRQGSLEITAAVSVTLPLLPSIVADRIPLQIPVSTSYVATVDRFRG